MQNTALITGASSGIGKELAYIHAKNNRDLILVARRESKLKELKDDISNKFNREVKIIVKDLSNPNSAKEIFDEVSASNIEVDFLINNAGFGHVGYFHEIPLERQVDMINLNVTSLTVLTRLFLPGMIERKRGKILNVSSTAGMVPGPLQAVYYATKAFVTSFSNAIAEELRGTGVTVTALLPGATETEFGDVSGMGKTAIFKKTASAQKVASDGYFAMMKGDLEIISGLPFGKKLMMKLTPFLPKKMVLKTIKEMQRIKD